MDCLTFLFVVLQSSRVLMRMKVSENRKAHSPRKGSVDSEQDGLRTALVVQEQHCLTFKHLLGPGVVACTRY